MNILIGLLDLTFEAIYIIIISYIANSELHLIKTNLNLILNVLLACPHYYYG